MNYGWAGPFTAWFTVDDLYCPWQGCDPLVEYLIRYIIPQEPVFIRADVNADGIVTMADPILTLQYLFAAPESPAPCFKAADVDDDGSVTFSDVALTLRYLYLPESQAPSAPFPDCGVDETTDDLGCATHPCADDEQNRTSAAIPAGDRRIDNGMSLP
jgi:hypothetical protein